MKWSTNRRAPGWVPRGRRSRRVPRYLASGWIAPAVRRPARTSLPPASAARTGQNGCRVRWRPGSAGGCPAVPCPPCVFSAPLSSALREAMRSFMAFLTARRRAGMISRPTAASTPAAQEAEVSLVCSQEMIVLRTAQRTISAVLCRLSFCIRLVRWVFTVQTLKSRIVAASLLDLPSARS